jgi:hypothetical protein
MAPFPADGYDRACPEAVYGRVVRMALTAG